MATRRRKMIGGLVITWLLLGSLAVAYAAEPELSPAAAAAIKAAFPEAKIGEVELENEDGMKLYGVELKQGGKELEVKVSPSGTIVAVETEVSLSDVPKEVAAAIKKAAEGGKIVEIEKEEVRAVQKYGQWLKLATPLPIYEAEYLRDGKRSEIQLAVAGTTIIRITQEAVSIDQVPQAVRRTLLREAGKNKIEEIENEVLPIVKTKKGSD